MNFSEGVLSITCDGDRLAGVLSLPQQPGELGVVVVVGGPQYRVGSHRQFVLLARHLAAHGIATLRFDCRGMGDSTGAQRPFEALSADISCAITSLVNAVPAVRRVALWGLCDGASAALLYLDEHADPRVSGLCLVNPWVRSAASLARTHIEHHYWRRLHEPAFWARVATGRVGLRALASLWRNISLTLTPRWRVAKGRERPFQQRMADAWRCFPGHILLLLSEDDYTADEFRGALATDPAWQEASTHARLEQHDIGGADHTMSVQAARLEVEALTRSWLLRLTKPPTR
jgi:uncharacterized protein